MNAKEREKLARRLYRIACRGAMASPARTLGSLFRGDRPKTFYAVTAPTQDGWRHLADWVAMDRRYVMQDSRRLPT